MATIVPRLYGGFRGVDFRGEEVNLARSPDSLNMWKDYRETDSIRTRPGMELKSIFLDGIISFFFYNDEILVHSGSTLYSLKGDTRKTVVTGLQTERSDGFVYEGIFYFKDGKRYLKYDGTSATDVVGYIPTTSIARKPGGGGTTLEDINMLSDYRYNSFVADGTSFSYYLDAQNIDTDFVPECTVDGVKDTRISVDYAQGKITFTELPLEPATAGQDNVVIKFKKTVPGYREHILDCTLLQIFDNRVFVSGNKEFPNVVWHCSLNDPSYFSDLDYYREGLDSSAIRGLVAGNNALWVFREPSDSNTTVFYHTPTLDDQYGKIYPSSHSSVTIGCTGRAVNFNDDIIFFSERGMEGISGDITTEQVVAHRSSLVDRELITEEKYRDMVLVEWEGYLIVFIGNKAYLADSRTAFTNEDHVEYEFFYWKMEKEIVYAKVHDGKLYLGTSDGIYTLTDEDAEMECWWVTPKDKFQYPNKLKTTNKRGCVAEATGDVTVFAKTEKTEFEKISEHEDVEDYFVSRIKRKKFKDIQLKFYSDTRFSLETVTLETFVGGYVKR